MLVKVMSMLFLSALASVATAAEFFVSPSGDDGNPGTVQQPFQTIARAQQAVREVDRTGKGDVVVNLAAGVYRLAKPWLLTEEDSGGDTCQVVYRSQDGPGKARLLGSVPLVGWQKHTDDIWKIDLPEGTLFHTLYENGRRAHKARFPDREYVPEMPVAAGRYLVTVDGTSKQPDVMDHVSRKGQGWLAYRPEDAPPVTRVTKMRIHIFGGGTFDWIREIRTVVSIDPETRRITMATAPSFGVGVGCRFFLEDELGLLNAAGEFFVDEPTHTLYYMPMGKGHPDTLGISYPAVSRMIQLRGKSRDQCIENIVLDGLALEETDDSPPLPLWAYAGHRDGALVWMNNAARIEIRNCHLKNSGRSGIMMIGHNVENRVAGCWIEHMGLNGVSLCNRFLAPNKKDPTEDRCENNRIHNTLISHVGELHTYAECVTVFNASNNEVDRCQLDNSARYAITVRGNTGKLYGPPSSTNYPPAKGNHFHHLRVFRCGQDGGDMGALHCANLNNPGGRCVNTFDQITVTDTAAIPSMKDRAPNGIFLDWPKMAMDQVFHNIQIIRSQGVPARSNRPDNLDSMQTENVSWKPGFREEAMDDDHIGLTTKFSAAYGGKRSQP